MMAMMTPAFDEPLLCDGTTSVAIFRQIILSFVKQKEREMRTNQFACERIFATSFAEPKNTIAFRKHAHI